MRFSKALNWLSKPKHLWGTMFLYTILTGLFVQLILLPHIFPSWHSQYGLIKNVDGRKFHRITVALSEKIEANGWSEWELLPRGQLVAGVAAIFYTIIHPAPWSVLPVNGFMNASACLCLFFIFSSLTRDRKKGLIASLPFFFYPSNLLWNTQFHNENYAIPGVIFMLYGWMLIARKRDNNQSPSGAEALVAILLIAIGGLLLGLVRVYILSGMTYLFIFTGIALSIYWLTQILPVRKYLARFFLTFSVCAIMLFIVSSIEALEADEIVDTEILNGDVVSTSASILKDPSRKWETLSWLPSPINDQFRQLAKYRNQFVQSWAHGGSSIDLDVTFSNTSEMIAYIPRAIQIGFLAPFPNIWVSKAKRDSGTAMRIASGFEMVLSCFCLLGLPFFAWRNRNQPAFWVIAFVCTAMLIVYAMIVPNVGSLYRFRYPYFMPMVCFGLAGWLEILPKLKGRALL